MLLSGAVAVAGCGSVADESDPAESSSESATATPPTNPDVASCAGSPVTPAILADAQFAFIGTVTAVEDAIHPWTTDPENPNRPGIPAPTPWVTFEIERWYLNDWGATFTVWTPNISINVGLRLAVGGNAYHTQVNGLSGQSGEIKFCTPIADFEVTPSAWDEVLGASFPPSPATSPTTTVALPATKEFGEHAGPCAPTILNNGPNDQHTLAAGVACFLTEQEAGRPVIWDVLIPTIEGAPIVSRYDYDGTMTTITTDYSFDNFGSGGVIEKQCSGVVATHGLPDGADCAISTGRGFRADSLP